MDPAKESLVLNVICLVFSLAALAVAGYTVVTGQMFRTGVDGLFLTLMCLLLALVFAINPLLALRNGELGGLIKGRQKSSAQPEAKQAAEQKTTSQAVR